MDVIIKRPGKIETGVVHGRFQILHNDHLKYLIACKQLCHHLVVGITNPDPLLTKKEHADPERHSMKANPLSYFERYTLIKKTLENSGFNHDQFSIVPFPINRPELYECYVPMDAIFFLSIYDDWGRKKLDYLESMGLKTYILRAVTLDKKGLSAKDIRDNILKGKPWKHMVPQAVVPFIEQWGIKDRLKKLKEITEKDNHP